MTKKRYIKNTLEFSLEQGVKNRGGKTNLFISSQAELNRHKARVYGNTPGDGVMAPAATERQAIPATESATLRGEIASPSGSGNIKGVIK